MKRYLFLVGWIDQSDTPTGIHCQADLYDQFKKGNDEVLALQVKFEGSVALLDETTLEEWAYALGCAKVFRANYTANDSLSDLIEFGPIDVIPDDAETKIIRG